MTRQQKGQRAGDRPVTLIGGDDIRLAVGVDVSQDHRLRCGADFAQIPANIAVAGTRLHHAVANSKEERNGVIVLITGD